MKRVPFKAGVHPFEGKAFSENEKIIKIEAAPEMVFPMSQHIGAPAVPTVKIGDRVLVGMKSARRLHLSQARFSVLFPAR